jgi:hypothetical protein
MGTFLMWSQGDIFIVVQQWKLLPRLSRYWATSSACPQAFTIGSQITRANRSLRLPTFDSPENAAMAPMPLFCPMSPFFHSIRDCRKSVLGALKSACNGVVPQLVAWQTINSQPGLVALPTPRSGSQPHNSWDLL